MTESKKTCRRCGDCCKNGGPALHREDLALLREGHISHRQLVAIKKGEPALSPASGQVEPAPAELLKIRGISGSWTCLFFRDNPVACAIYAHRPLECRLLECQAPDALIAIAGRDLLNRLDLINPNDPVRELIAEHDAVCDASKLAEMIADFLAGRETERTIARMEEMVRKDLDWRQRAMTEHGIDRDYELFIFGRPVFLSLVPYGIQAVEENGAVRLSALTRRSAPPSPSGRG